MTVHFDVTDDHYKKLRTYYIRHLPVRKKIFLLIIALIPVFCLYLRVRYDMQNNTINNNNIGLILPLIIFFIFLNLSLSMFIKKRKNKKSKGNSLIGERTLTLQDDCIETIRKNSMSRVFYTAVVKICYDIKGKCYYIFISAQEALIIPEQAFENENQKAEFVGILMQKTGVTITE